MEETVTCRLCGRVFDAREDLDEHMDAAHGARTTGRDPGADEQAEKSKKKT